MPDNRQKIYNKLVESGYKGTYEQFDEYLNGGEENVGKVYNKLASAGYKGTIEQFSEYAGIAQKRVTVEDVQDDNPAQPTVVTLDPKDTSFDDWYPTVPADRNDTTNYNLRRAFELAPAEELEAWRTATPEELERGEKHLRSVYENENGEYEFMKSKNHPTLKMELDWYNSDDADAVEFKRKYRIETEGSEYYKYVNRGLDLDDMSFANYKKNEERLMSISKEIEEATGADISDFDIEDMRAHAADPNHIADLGYEKALLQDYIKRAVVSDEYAQSVGQVRQLTDKYRAENGIGRGDYMNKSRRALYDMTNSNFGIKALGLMSYAQNSTLAAADFVIYGIEQQTKRSEKRIEDYNNGKKGVFSDFGRGFVTTNWNALDPLQTLNLAEQSFKIARKFNDDGTLKEGESLTDGEQKLLDALVIARAADSTLIDTMWERVGANATEQLKYTLEFVLTSELAGARLFSGKVAKAATKKIENAALRKITNKVVDYAIQPTLQTVYNPLNLYQNTLERMTGEVVIDGNGEFAGFKGGEEAWPAFRDAFVASYIENFSEKIGEDIFKPIVKPLKYGNKKLRNMDNAFGSAYNQLATKIDIAIENAGLHKLDDVLKISKDIRLSTGFQGIPGEHVEEVVGGIMNAMFVGDQSFHQYDENGNPNPNYLWNSEQQLETFLSCAVMSIGMTAVSNIRNGVTTAVDRRNAKSYLDAATKAMRNQGFDVDAIDKAFKKGTLKDASQELFITGAAENMTDDKRQILSNYIAAKINYKAMRHADMGALEEKFKVIEDEARASVNAETKDLDGNGGRIIQANVEVNGEMLEGVAVVSGKVLTRIETDANGNDIMVLGKGSSSVLYVRVPGEAKPRAIYSSQVKSIVAATNVDEYIEKQKNMLTGMMTEMFGAQYEDGLPLGQLIAECAVLSNKEMQIGKTSVSLEKGRKYHVFDNRSGKIVEAAFVEDTQMDGEQYHVFNINGENMEMTDSELKESMLRYRLQLAEESGAQDEAAQIELDALLRERDADMATRPVSEDQMIETVVSSEAAKDENGNYTPDSSPRAVAVDILMQFNYDADEATLAVMETIRGLMAQINNYASEINDGIESASIDENILRATRNNMNYNNSLIAMYNQVIAEIDLYMQNYVGEPEIGETYALTNENGTVYGRFEGYDADGNVTYRETDENGENDGRLVVLPKNEFQKQRRAHNIEIQAQKPITIDNAKEIAEQTPVMPTEQIEANAEEAKVEKSPAQETYDGLYEKYGDKAAHKIDVTVADREAVLEKARKDFEKAQQAYDEAPIGKEEKAEKALEKAQQAYNDALTDKQLWDEVKAVKDRMAAEQLAKQIEAEKQTEIENEQKRLDELVSNRDKELREIDEAEDKQSALEFAEQEVDTNPTDAQKEAGNYKKGHVTIDGFDISIENPRGSVRSGVDENGNEWSVTMHYTYGYIRNTESVDGDHIDIFLSDHIGNWNGSVFVVDQVKPDGSFDEHKVMYGFDTVEEATAAYLANYSEGWQGLGKITYVSKRGFKKWIDSSHRKTKPFAEYKEILLSHQKEESKRVFKEDEKDRRLEALRRRHGSQLNMNINPQDLEDLLYVAGYHIENGVRKFADFCKGMITDLGDWVRPYLKQIYSACKYDEDIAKLNVPFEEWTEDREVSTFDVANFDKETADLAQTVEMVENEKKAEENINEINTQNEQTAANTEAIVGKAEALADQAESDVENITTEQQGNEIADNIDKAIDKINDQLALLGYYEADASDESQFHESYGYMRTAEKKAVKDMERLARQVAKDLGIEVGRKQLAEANIAPAGGDVSFRLPLTDSKELHLWVRVVPDGYTPGYGYADDLVIEDMVGIGGGVLRIEDPKASIDRYGHNHNFSGKITYDDLIREIKFQISMYDKEFYDKMQEKLAAKESVEKTEKKTKKTPKQSKNSLTLQQSLFDTQDDNELKEDNNGQQRTDELRSEGMPAESVRHEQGGRAESEAAGGRAEEEAGRADTDRGRASSESDRSEQSGLRELRNQNNNHAERGTDYAPKSVDARIEANIKAIELMQQLIESGEQATPEQMATLRQFSGWGGLGKAFTDNPYGYSPNARLKTLLGEEAYEQANMSRNSAYYTPANVIDMLWDIAKALGFKGGNILEGSAGIGNILGLMPTEISNNSSIHAVEIDQTAGNILSLLYPDANVEVQGFEATKIENGSIDLAITNVPFVTGLRVNDTTGDKDLSKKFHDIHDFCIAKNIRKLREGGIGIFITSSGTLDNSTRLREWIVSEGNTDVVGAFRLNNETFGGTGATSDIIVVRKRVNGVKSPNAIDVREISSERVAEYKTGDVKKVKGEYVAVTKQLSMDYNAYYIAHPDMMAGKMYFGFEKDDNYRATSKALYPAGKNQNEMLANWAKSFSKMDWSSNQQAPAEATTNVYESLGDNIKEGSMLVNKKGVLCIAQRGSAVPLDVNANKVKGHTKVECFNSYQSIKQALADVLNYQTQNDDDSGLKPLLDKLNRVYDSFIRIYGNLHKNTSITFLKNDVDFANVLALETFKETGDANGNKIQVYGKTDVFTKRVVEKDKAPEPTNIKDGIIASIYLHGKIDIPYLSKQLNMSEDEVKSEIIKQGLGFENPASREIEVSYEYLSGNVREKLEQAIENNIDGRYDNNIKELEKVIPMTIPSHLIEFSIGSSWIEPKLYVDYIKERTDIDVEITGAGGSWYVKTPYYLHEQKNRSFGVFSKMLNKLVYGTQLIDAAMNNRSITVSESHKNADGSTETTIDKEATQACASKIDEIRQDFKDWAKAKMQSDMEMSQRIERVYNDMFNNYVPKDIPDDFIPEYFGGATHNIKLRKHQAKAVIRATTQPLMLAHEVGTGKTFTLISTAMEMRRLGTAKKPMIVVQNATVGQFVESAKQLYPNAKVLTIEDKDHTGEGRKNFYAKIKYNDWDMIVVPQSVFERIPDSEERQMAFVQDKIEEKLLVLQQMKDADGDGNSMIVRQAEKELSQLETQKAEIGAAMQERRKKRDEKKEAVTKQNAEVKALEMLDRATDDVENFDDMGIDAILVDEAHEYKHLGFATAMQRGVKGVDPSYSKKAQGVFLKTQAVLEKNNGRNVVFATGTPISNTAAEIWTFMRYLMPADTMQSYGIYYFDDFVRNFGNLQQMLEFTTSGKFKENNRFAGYVNLPELVRIWSSVADTVLTREAGGVNDKIPDMEGGKAQDIYLPQTKALRSVMKYVKSKLEEYENMTGKQKKENSHIPLVMYGIAKAAAVDARLVMDEAEDDPNSKTNEAVRQILRSLNDTKGYKGTVAIFADNYQNKQSKFNIYDDIKAKLVEAGIPENQIVVMRSGMSVKKKLEIFDKMNSGEVRVMLGSTFTLGTGVNIQERLHTLIHLDAPNRPMDYTQRNGRILRQGNLHKQMNKPVRVLRFGVEDSLDVTAYQRLKTKGAIADSIMNGKAMMINNMENRVLEEEEDVFGDTVAQLSGSEYAMLKNQAEKDVRKYEAKYKQWQADQIYVRNEMPNVEKWIKYYTKAIADAKKYLDIVNKAYNGTFDITVGKLKFNSLDAMKDFITEYNKSIMADEGDVKSANGGEKNRTLTINVNGIDFVVKTNIKVEMLQQGATLVTSSRRSMMYSCEQLGLDAITVKQSLLRNALEDITSNIMTGKEFKDDLQTAQTGLARNEKALEQLKQRNGKAFEYSEELEKSRKRLEEYTEAMKKEMEEKEKKYAEMDAEVEAADNLIEAEEGEDDETEEDNNRYSVRTESAPKKTKKVYKLMRLEKGGLYPLFIDKNSMPIHLKTWYNADSPNMDMLKSMPSGVFLVDYNNGTYTSLEDYANKRGIKLKDKQKYPAKEAIDEASEKGLRWVYIEETAKGQKRYDGETRKYWNLGINGSGSVSTFAMRPGWHAGSLPTMRQIGKGTERNLRDAKFVWVEGEIAADVDYQNEAEGNPDNDIPTHIPENGFYLKATNADKAKSQADRVGWYVSGAFKAVRVIGDNEARRIIDEYNESHPDAPVEYDYEREGDVMFTDEDARRFNDTARESADIAFNAVLESLSKAGIEVVEATDEEVREMRKNSKPLRTSDGMLMGWVDADGKIHLSKEGMNAETAVHEYTHLWVDALRANNLKLWEQIRDMLIKDNPMYDEIKKSAAYSNIKDNDDMIAEEILARISGKQNAIRMEDSARKVMDENPGVEGAVKAASLIERLRDALREFWSWCGKTLFGKEDTLTTEQVTEMILADLVNGVNPDNTPGKGTGIKASVDGERVESEVIDMNTTLVSDILDDKLGVRKDGGKRHTIKRRMIEFERKWFDSLTPLKKMQDVIAEQTGKPLSDYEDAYNAELRRSSITMPKIEKYTDDYLIPMIEASGDILKYAKDNNIDFTQKDWDLFLIALHGLERNEYYKKLNEWDETRDMSGLTALAKELGRDDEDFTEAAEDYVEQVKSMIPKAMLDNALDGIKASTNAILDIYLESGLISRQQYKDYKSRYEHYVPLRGWSEVTSDEFYDYSVLDPHFQSAIKHTKGRTSLAFDVLANVMNMMESAVVLGEKNKVLQRLFNLAQNRKTDVLKTQSSWYVKDTDGAWIEVLPEIQEGMSAAQAAEAIKAFEEEMKRREEMGEAKRKINFANVGVKIKPFNQHEHYVPVFVNGQKHAIIINGDPSIVKALTDKNELQNNKFVSFVRTTTRLKSQLNTTFNPEFVLRNVIRDAGMAMISSYIEGGIGYANNVRKNINLFGRRYLGQLIRNGKCDNDTYAQYWKEFIENGGETGFTRTLNAEQQAKKLKKLYQRMLDGKSINDEGNLTTIIDAIDSINRWGEDLSRFAVFVTNREMGKSVEQSVNMAKNSTINFQRKGGGTFAAYLRTSRSFFNATMQALYRFGSLAKNNPKRFSIACTAIAISGAIVPLLNIMMLSLMGDDDDWKAYRFMTDYTGNHNWHMFVGNGFITIPYPQEFAALFAAGNIAFRHLIGWSDGTIAGDIGSMVMEQIPFDFAGKGRIDHKLIAGVTPQIMQEFWDVYYNEDFMGRPIYKKTPFNENDPAWTKAYKSTSGTLVDFAKYLNGNDPISKHSETWDWLNNPAAWQYVATNEAGGVGRILNNVSRLIENGYTSDNMPFLRNLYMTSDMSKFAPNVNSQYYNLMTQFNELTSSVNGYEKSGETMYEQLDRYIKLKTGPEYMANEITKELQKTIKEMQDNLKLMQAYDASDEQIDMMRENITNLQIMVLDITNNMIIEEGRPITKQFRDYVDGLKNNKED